MDYFIDTKNNCDFDSQMQQFNMRGGLPILPRLVAASRRAAYKQLKLVLGVQTKTIFWLFLTMKRQNGNICRVWNVPTAQTMHLLKVHEGPITGLSLHATGIL